MYTLLTVLNYISVFIMITCVVLVATHESSKMQKLAMMVCMLLLVCCVGFLIKSEGNTVDSLIIGQKLVYATVTHAMFVMLLFILEYCKFGIPKLLKWICHGVNLLITVVVLTLEYHKLFYVECWVEDVGGHTELMKEYGPMHTLAVVVFAVYMVSAVLIAVLFSVKNIKKRSSYVWRLLVAVSLPCLAYIIPKLTDTNNELQPIAFSLFTVMLLTMVYRSKIYDVNNIAAEYSVKSLNNALIVFNTEYSFKGCNDVAYKLFPFLSDTNIDKDISQKSSVIKDGLDGAISEYTVDDKIYNVSVRPVNSGGIVIGRVLWFEDVTMERKYTKLLQSQKKDLESQVETLYDISHKDDITGIYNRRGYERAIDEIRKKKDISDLIIAEFDINGLKTANDEIGHNAGDELIIATAQVLTKVFSKHGDIFRTGGDEFFVIISDKDADIEALNRELESTVNAWRGTLNEKLSLAYGFVKASENIDMNIDELMIAADKAMYKDKARFYSIEGNDRRKQNFV